MQRFIRLTLCMTLAACVHDEHDDDHEDLDAEACEHMVEGPDTDVIATASATGAPDVSESHRRWDVTVSGSGFVSFASSEAGDLVIFASKDVPLTLRDADSTVVAAEASENPFLACTEVAVSHTFEVGVGTYTIELGPTTETLVSLVIEAGAHEEE